MIGTNCIPSVSLVNRHDQKMWQIRTCFKQVCNCANACHIRGSFLLSRLANYNPKRFSAYIFIDHGYIVPGQGLKTEVIKNVNDSVQASLGFSIFGYFLFFDEDDASSMMDKHVRFFVPANLECLF